MTTRLCRSFEKLERQKDVILSEVAAWSAARMRFQPDPASWSTLDVLDHLVKVEQAVVGAAWANLPDGHPVSLKSVFSAYMVIGVMRSRARVKVPAGATRVLPERALDPSTLAQHWQAERAVMAAFLETLSPAQLRRGLFRHPVSGWMSMPHAMAFLSAHLGHHRPQLARLQRASNGL